MPSCPECGSQVDESDNFCTNCGHSFEGEELEVSGEPDGESQGTDRISVPSDPFELDVFEFSFKYPLANGFKATAVSVLLILLSFFVIPYFMFLGYTYRMGRAAALGRASPPEIGDYWGLLADGFRLFVAVGTVMIPVMAVYLALLLTDRVMLAYLVYFPMLLVMSAINPIFYGTGSVRGVYSNGRFLRFLTTSNFWIGFAYQLGIGFLAYITIFVVTFVLIFTLIGIPVALGLWVVFPAYFALLNAALWGRIYHDAAKADAVDGPHNPETIESSW